MDANETYFVTLLNAFLNGQQPPINAKADWEGIFQLAKKHDVSGILAQCIKALPQEYQPKGVLASQFTQTLGYTLISFEKKERSTAALTDCLNHAKIRHLLVKGPTTQRYYPVPALRTCGDTDVVVAPTDYDRTVESLEHIGFELLSKHLEVATLLYLGQRFEIHNELDDIGNKNKALFSDYFSPALSHPEHEYTYYLNDDLALYYTVIHLLHHVKIGGAGIRMLMDVDVLLRHTPKVLINFYKYAEEAELLQSCTYIISLCKLWFDTPVAADLPNTESALYQNMEFVVLNGGTFGKQNGGLGSFYLQKQIKNDGKITLMTRLKTFLRFLFPDKDYMQRGYPYAAKYPILLGAAYMQRIITGLFKRNKQSMQSLRGITSDSDHSKRLFQINQELGI